MAFSETDPPRVAVSSNSSCLTSEFPDNCCFSSMQLIGATDTGSSQQLGAPAGQSPRTGRCLPAGVRLLCSHRSRDDGKISELTCSQCLIIKNQATIKYKETEWEVKGAGRESGGGEGRVDLGLLFILPFVLSPPGSHPWGIVQSISYQRLPKEITGGILGYKFCVNRREGWKEWRQKN